MWSCSGCTWWMTGLTSVPRERQWRPDAFNTVGSYWDAQSRQLEFMRRNPLAKALKASWVLLADDDTFVQVEELLDFVSRYDAQLPVLFGYVLSDAHVLGYDYPCGGAGMLLSASAYDLLAPRILTDCPLLAFNDLTLGFCAHAQGVPMVHHHGMHCAPDLNRAMRPQENLLDIQKALAVHRLIGFQSFTDLVGTLEMFEGVNCAPCCSMAVAWPPRWTRASTPRASFGPSRPSQRP